MFERFGLEHHLFVLVLVQLAGLVLRRTKQMVELELELVVGAEIGARKMKRLEEVEGLV